MWTRRCSTICGGGCATRAGRTRAGRRLVTGHPARLRPGRVHVLGRRVRLAGPGGGAQPVRPVHHHDRRPRRALHPRPLAARGCAAAADHPRLARLDRRVPQGHRAADEPDGVRRRCGRRVPRRRTVAAGLRVLRQADSDRLGRRARSREVFADADGPPRLRPLPRPGRRLGLGGDDGRSARPTPTTAPPSTSRWRWAPARSSTASRPPRNSGRSPARPTTRSGTRATRSSRARARRPSATASSTRPRRRRRGSSRSSGPGPTATGTPRTCSPATSCSTT